MRKKYRWSLEKKMRAALIALTLCMASILCVSCIFAKQTTEPDQTSVEEFTPTPLTIETKDITESEKFREAVSEEVHNILNDDVVVTVYADGVKDFSYRGRVELANDGSDGTEVILFIYADKKTMLDEVF